MLLGLIFLWRILAYTILFIKSLRNNKIKTVKRKKSIQVKVEVKNECITSKNEKPLNNENERVPTEEDNMLDDNIEFSTRL